MSTKQSSRLTLADILDRISGADLPPKVKADMSSAVRKVATILGADPGLIPVDPANIRRRLEGISHQVAGVSSGRWNNIRSLFSKSIAMVTPSRMRLGGNGALGAPPSRPEPRRFPHCQCP